MCNPRKPPRAALDLEDKPVEDTLAIGIYLYKYLPDRADSSIFLKFKPKKAFLTWNHLLIPATSRNIIFQSCRSLLCFFGDFVGKSSPTKIKPNKDQAQQIFYQI